MEETYAASLAAYIVHNPSIAGYDRIYGLWTKPKTYVLFQGKVRDLEEVKEEATYMSWVLDQFIYNKAIRVKIKRTRFPRNPAMGSYLIKDNLIKGHYTNA